MPHHTRMCLLLIIKLDGKIVSPYSGKYHFEMEVAYWGYEMLFNDGQKMMYDAKAKLIKGDKLAHLLQILLWVYKCCIFLNPVLSIAAQIE